MRTLSTKQKAIVITLVLIVVVAVAGVIVWDQFYRPKNGIVGPIWITDDYDRNVTIADYPPSRIVSLAPSCTEILFALGLGDKIVGIDDYAYYPSEIQEQIDEGNITTVGQYANINIETVVGLEADLIIAAMRVQHSITETLGGLGQPAMIITPGSFDEVIDDISLIGEATGQIDEAKELVSDMERRAQEIADKTEDTARPRVYIEYSFNGGYYSFGAESFASELIFKAGGINVFAGFGGAYISTSTEEVLKANPDIIIIAKGAMSEFCGLTPETIRARPGWGETNAVQEDQIYEMDERFILPGPAIIDGLDTMALIIHPEIFE